nr:MMPL family transporter [Thermoanaerobaculia bacterium]
MSRRPEGLPLGAIAHPRLALALGFLITLALAPGLGRLRLATDGRALVPPADPVLALDHEVERRFGLRDSLLVVIRSRHPDGIFNTATLQRLERLTRALQALPELGAEHVVSLATEHSPRFGARGFDYLPFLEPPPESPERLAEVREEVAATDLFRGTLVAEDGRSTAILVGVPPPTAASAADRAELYHRIEALARPFASAEDSLEVVGAPAAEALLGEHILADLRVLVPLAVGMIALVLWLTCSGGWGAGIGLLKMGAALAATLGLIGWLGEPLYLTTAVTPVILVSIGLADEIHLLWEYRQRRGRGEAREAALAGTFQALTRPVILTSLTTAAGFLSFATSSIRPVASFGLATGFGVLFCLGWALTVTPALLALAPQRAFADARVAHGSAAWAERWARAL